MEKRQVIFAPHAITPVYAVVIDCRADGRSSRASLVCAPKISLALAAFLLQHSPMTKRALFAVAGFLSLCVPLSAQQTYRPDLFSALNNAISLPSLSLSDGQRFSFWGAVAAPISLSWMEPTPPDFLPAVSPPSPQTTTARPAYAKDSSKEVVDMQKPNLLDYATGEVSVLYGRSTGKFSGDLEQAYIFGEVGNDKFHISVGAGYENSNIRFSRFGH
jgi:hypothetical protein